MRLISRLSLVVASVGMAGASLAVPLAYATDSNPDNTNPPNTISVEPDTTVTDNNLPVSQSDNLLGTESTDQVPTESGADGTVDAPAASEPTAEFVVQHPVSDARNAAINATVQAEGWVTATYPTGGLDGYVIQTAGSGGACDFTKTSEGIFVFVGKNKPASDFPAIGEYVNVSGKRDVYNGLHQISGPTTTKVADTTGIPAATPLTCAWPATEAERGAIQSMSILPPGPWTVTNNYDANTYGSLTISATEVPLQQPTDVAEEGSDLYNATIQLNDQKRVVLDDGSSLRFAGASGANSANQQLIPPYVFNDARTAVGAKVTFTKPVIVDYRNKAWTLNTTTQISQADALSPDAYPATFEATVPAAPTATSLGGADITVGGFNLENFFPMNQGASWKTICTSYADKDGVPITTNRCPDFTENGITATGPRGPWDKVNLARQTTKLVAAINSLDASVLGVPELENTFKLSFGDKTKANDSAKYLVDALNSAAGKEKWSFVAPDVDAAEPADYQDVMYPGIIYQPAKVTPIGKNLVLNDQSAPGQAFGNARAPFGHAFEPAAGGKPFFFVANHFKSKSCDSGVTSPPQGCWNSDRVNQAKAVMKWVNDVALPQLQIDTHKTVEDVVLIGDFNAYTFEDPMLAFYAGGYTNVNVKDGAPVKSSYNYSGLNGTLDHVLISASTEARMTGSDIWDINGSQSIAYNYSRFNATGGAFVQGLANSPLRSSDHSPTIVGFKADPNVSKIQLLNINDFHGRIAGDLGPGVKGCPVLADDTRQLTKSPTMDFAYTIENLKSNPEMQGTLFLSDGDNIGASLFVSAVQRDKPTIDLLKALGLQASAVGNHEFDGGRAWINQYTGWIDGAFPYLAANVIDESTGKILEPFKASTMLDVDGVKVAVVGAVTQETPSLVSPAGIAGLKFTDPVDAVNAEVDRLMALPEADRPDLVVAEYHDGASEGTGSTLEAEMAQSPTFEKLVKQTSAHVNVIFTGHTHKEYAWKGPIPGVEGKTRPVLQTGSYGQNIGRVVLGFNNVTHDVSVIANENVATAGFAAGKSIDVLKNYNNATAEAYKITRDAVVNGDCEGGKVTGRLAAPISRAYTACDYVDGKATLAAGAKEDRGGASPMGTLVANMLRTSLDKLPGGVDFGVTNPGGLRTDLPAGDITVAQARDVLPFNNELSIVTLTGAQIYTMLEQQWQRTESGAVPTRPFLYLGLSDNVRYTYHEVADPANPGAMKGVVDSVSLNGKSIDKATQYKVATFTFLATAGDNFWVFGKAPKLNTGLLDYEQWLAYLASESGTEGIAPDFAKQGVKVETEPADGTVEAGDALKATFSGLNICAKGAPLNTEATLSVLAPFGSSQQTGAVSDGKVEFSVPTPADTRSGALILDMSAQPSGTKATVEAKVDGADAPLVVRHGGKTRYDTSYEVVKATIAAGKPLFVATGKNFPDALAGGAAAAKVDGSLLLVGNAIPKATLDLLKDNVPSDIYLLGGKSVVSEAVSAQLKNATGVVPVRVSGATRYKTAEDIAVKFFPDASCAYVASGKDFPDALAASGRAGHEGCPIVLYGPGGGKVPSSATAVSIAGGTGVVPDKYKMSLEQQGKTVTRYSGKDRFETAQALQLDNAKEVWVANGFSFPDALSAVAPSGSASNTLVLSRTSCIPKGAMSTIGSNTSTVRIVGGTAVLDQNVFALKSCDK